jgi:hypothetical protein
LAIAGGQHDDAYIRLQPEFPGKGQSIHAREIDIEENDVKGSLTNPMAHAVGIFGLADIEPMLSQARGQQASARGIIVDQ